MLGPISLLSQRSKTAGAATAVRHAPKEATVFPAAMQQQRRGLQCRRRGEEVQPRRRLTAASPSPLPTRLWRTRRRTSESLLRWTTAAVLLAALCGTLSHPSPSLWKAGAPVPVAVEAFSVVWMGAAGGRRGRRRTKGGDDLKKRLLVEEDDNPLPSTVGGGGLVRSTSRSLNRGRGQEITGVTLPAEGKVKGWEFGQSVRLACANVKGRYYALEGACPRCGFDLWRGDVIADDPAFDDLPRLACPTCGTTYALSTGKSGPPVRRTGLAAFVGNLAKTATTTEAGRDAKAYLITRDEADNNRVYCRER